jgi:hypothetical protein
MKKIFTLTTILFLGLALAGTAHAQKNVDKKKEDKKKKESSSSGNDKKASDKKAAADDKKGGADSKEEKKIWKKKAKSYVKDPMALKKELEDNNKQLKELTAKNTELQKKYNACNARVDSLQSLISAKDAEIRQLQAQKEKLQAQLEATKNIVEKDIMPGLVYKVQMGAFVHFDMNKYLKDTGENFEGETMDGMNKYTVGKFKELEVAEQFRKDVIKLGIKDAWIVPYIDGRRVEMKDARAYLEKQGGGKMPVNDGPGGKIKVK